MISPPLCLLKLCSDLRYGGLRPFCIPSAFFRVYQSLRPTHLKGKEGLIAPLLTPGNDHCEHCGDTLDYGVTPTPWLKLLLVPVKSRVNQKSC